MGIPLFLRVLYVSLDMYSNLSNYSTKSKSWLHQYLTLPLQALPSLIISVVGLIMAGVLMDQFQVKSKDAIYKAIEWYYSS